MQTVGRSVFNSKGKSCEKDCDNNRRKPRDGNAIALQLGKDGFNIVLFATSPEASCKGLEKFNKERIDYVYVSGNLALTKNECG